MTKIASRSTDISGGSSLLSKASSSSAQSLASLRDSLPKNPNIYRYRELADATAQFASGRLGKSFVWKYFLRGKTVVVTVRNRMREIRDFRSGLREICNAHHASIVNSWEAAVRERTHIWSTNTSRDRASGIFG